METINEQKTVTARKDHVCSWCGLKIRKGDRYNRAVYKLDDIYTWKSHIKCMELVRALKMDDECDDGVTSDDFHEYIIEEFRSLWREIDNERYESEGFEIPNFKQQLEFVYNHRVINQIKL